MPLWTCLCASGATGHLVAIKDTSYSNKKRALCFDQNSKHTSISINKNALRMVKPYPSRFHHCFAKLKGNDCRSHWHVQDEPRTANKWSNGTCSTKWHTGEAKIHESSSSQQACYSFICFCGYGRTLLALHREMMHTHDLCPRDCHLIIGPLYSPFVTNNPLGSWLPSSFSNQTTSELFTSPGESANIFDAKEKIKQLNSSVYYNSKNIWYDGV
jgi:hypothetical protein